MCSEQCPCAYTDPKVQKQYKELKFTELATFGRCADWPEYKFEPTKVARRLAACKGEKIIFPAAV